MTTILILVAVWVVYSVLGQLSEAAKDLADDLDNIGR